MFELSVEGYFSAAHQVKGYPGDCAGLHGHTYKIQVMVRVKKLDRLGMAVDFRSIKSELDRVIGKLDHTNLNKIAFFSKNNATAEYVAKYIFEQMRKKTPIITSVTVWEGPNYSVKYSPDEV
jgi:6-pyruvoyltetrahydropterin/6-carboxytetrahydropterin synthase